MSSLVGVAPTSSCTSTADRLRPQDIQNDDVEQTQDAELIADLLGTKVTDQFADGGVLRGDSKRAPSIGAELKCRSVDVDVGVQAVQPFSRERVAAYELVLGARLVMRTADGPFPMATTYTGTTVPEGAP